MAKKKTPPDREVLLSQFAEYKTIKAVAGVNGVTPVTARKWLAGCGIIPGEKKEALCLDDERIRKMYMDDRLSIPKIAKKFGIEHHRMYYYITRRLKLARVPGKYDRKIGDINDVIQLYQEGKSIARIAKQFGVDYSTIYHSLDKRGLIRKKPNREDKSRMLRQIQDEHLKDGIPLFILCIRHGAEFSKVQRYFYFKRHKISDREIIWDLIFVQNLTHQQIGEKFGVPAEVISDYVRKHNIIKNLRRRNIFG